MLVESIVVVYSLIVECTDNRQTDSRTPSKVCIFRVMLSFIIYAHTFTLSGKVLSFGFLLPKHLMTLSCPGIFHVSGFLAIDSYSLTALRSVYISAQSFVLVVTSIAKVQ